MTTGGSCIFAALSAIVVPAWWIALYRSLSIRSAFVPAEAWPAFQTVLIPDMILTIICATLALQLLRGRVSKVLVGAACGAWAYATAYSIAWARAVDAPVLGPALMVAGLAGFAMVWHAVDSPRAPRAS